MLEKKILEFLKEFRFKIVKKVNVWMYQQKEKNEN